MKLKLGIAFVFMAAFAAAQNSRYDGIALGPKGPIPKATVAICTQPASTGTQPCTPLANLCSSLSDVTCTSQNPVTADSLGNYNFYFKNVQTPFTVQIYGPQVAAPVIFTDQSAAASSLGGNNAWTGINTSSNLNRILYVDGVTYSTPEAAIAACPASPTGCLVYHTRLNSTSAGFTLGNTSCPNYLAQGLQLDPGAQVTLNGKASLICGAHIYGFDPLGNIFFANSGLANGPVIDLGDNLALDNASVENIRINAQSQTNITGIRARGINDNSYIRRNLIQNYTVNGISVDGSTQSAANFEIYGNQLGAGSGASDGISIQNAGISVIGRNTTVSNLGTGLSGAGIKIFGTASNPAPHFVFSHHTENYADSVLVDGKTSAAIIADDNAASTTNTLHVAATATGAVAAIMLHNNNNAAGNVVKNDVTGTTLAAANPPSPFGLLPFYFWENNGPEFWMDINGLHLNAKDLFLGSGVAADQGGFKHKRAVAGCATAASAGATCTTTFSWTTAFADANYTVSCTGDGITSGIPLHGGITAKVAASVTFQTVAATAAAAQYTNIECIAVHD